MPFCKRLASVAFSFTVLTEDKELGCRLLLVPASRCESALRPIGSDDGEALVLTPSTAECLGDWLVNAALREGPALEGGNADLKLSGPTCTLPKRVLSVSNKTRKEKQSRQTYLGRRGWTWQR